MPLFSLQKEMEELKKISLPSTANWAHQQHNQQKTSLPTVSEIQKLEEEKERIRLEREQQVGLNEKKLNHGVRDMLLGIFIFVVYLMQNSPECLTFQMRVIAQQNQPQPRPVWGGNATQQTSNIRSKSLMEIQMEEAKQQAKMQQQQQQKQLEQQQQPKQAVSFFFHWLLCREYTEYSRNQIFMNPLTDQKVRKYPSP